MIKQRILTVTPAWGSRCHSEGQKYNSDHYDKRNDMKGKQ